jgi:hypothetical protein
MINDVVCSQQLKPKTEFFGQNLAMSSVLERDVTCLLDRLPD